jgi:hypothetical protein
MGWRADHDCYEDRLSLKREFHSMLRREIDPQRRAEFSWPDAEVQWISVLEVQIQAGHNCGVEKRPCRHDKMQLSDIGNHECNKHRERLWLRAIAAAASRN